MCLTVYVFMVVSPLDGINLYMSTPKALFQEIWLIAYLLIYRFELNIAKSKAKLPASEFF